ncbi:MAG: glycoside hydrolase family 32 protein [Dehalococcoidia bacterium]
MISYPDSLDAQLEALKEDTTVLNYTASRERLSIDPARPLYHFSPPENYMNDPNGICHWGGMYHLFYQFRPDGVDNVHWGHAMSKDLVHWKDLPIALYPDQERDCFSGQTLVEDERVIATYHGTGSGNSIATATDPLLLNWEKHSSNPVIPMVDVDEHGRPYRVFDPCIWKEDGGYYALSGVFQDGERSIDCKGVDHLFRSQDLERWDYVGKLIESDYRTEPGEDYAVPNFWPISNDKHMLLFFSHKRGGQYFVGDYDTDTHRFSPDYHGRMNYGPLALGSLHAPSSTIDNAGRYLSIFNVKESREPRGWDNVMTLPRVLSLAHDNSLLIAPVPELEAIRFNEKSVGESEIPANEDVILPDIVGSAIEIQAVIDPKKAREVGLNVLRSPDATEFTRISFFHRGNARWGTPQLQIDGSQSSTAADVLGRPPETGPLNIPDGDLLRLRIFIDRSIIEVFANDIQCLTLRTYPESPDSTGVSMFAKGSNATLKSLDCWQMRSVWPELKDRQGQ